MMNLWEPDDNVTEGVFTTASRFDVAMRRDGRSAAAVANFRFIFAQNCCRFVREPSLRSRLRTPHGCHAGAKPMSVLTIRPARADEYDAIADVWLRSWLSNGIANPQGDESSPLTVMRERIPKEIANGWSLFVADDNGTIAAMLAFRPRDSYLDQLFIAPEYQSNGLGKRLLAFTRENLPHEIWLRCVRENERAWRWYEREGFVFEKEELDPRSGFSMKYYRWKRTMR